MYVFCANASFGSGIFLKRRSATADFLHGESIALIVPARAQTGMQV
jgi:hypothetical protein